MSTQDNTSHLSEIRLVQLARTGEDHPHLRACAFCREQYDALRDMLFGASGEHRGAAEGEVAPFRLAAQSEIRTDEDERWRQTWYLQDGALVVRVVEDIAEAQLVGFVIGDPDGYARLRIRFSGLEETFVPDSRGRFVIGPPSIPIEPMRVEVEEED